MEYKFERSLCGFKNRSGVDVEKNRTQYQMKFSLQFSKQKSGLPTLGVSGTSF
jgi:hypothetical protein